MRGPLEVHGVREVVRQAGRRAMDGDRSAAVDLETDGVRGEVVRGRTDRGRAGGELALARLAHGLVSDARRYFRYVRITDISILGWTSGSWATDAPWTTWSGCLAQTTATSVYTTTVTEGNGTVATLTTTGYGVQLAQATGSSSGNGAGSLRDGSSFGLAASAVGAMGVLAGALLL